MAPSTGASSRPSVRPSVKPTMSPKYLRTNIEQLPPNPHPTGHGHLYPPAPRLPPSDAHPAPEPPACPARSSRGDCPRLRLHSPGRRPLPRQRSRGHHRRPGRRRQRPGHGHDGPRQRPRHRTQASAAMRRTGRRHDAPRPGRVADPPVNASQTPQARRNRGIGGKLGLDRVRRRAMDGRGLAAIGSNQQ